MKDVFKRAKAILANATATSAEEEFAYFIAKTEIEDGSFSEGLMSKAFSIVGKHGEEEHAKYIELRAQQLLKDTSDALKRVRQEWVERIRQVEMEEAARVRARAQEDFKVFKASLDEKYDVQETLLARKQLKEDLVPIKELEGTIQDGKGFVGMWLSFSVATLVIVGVALADGTKGSVSFFGICSGISLFLAFLNGRKHLDAKKHFDQEKKDSIEAELGEVEKVLSKYEKELKAHPGYHVVSDAPVGH
jgi:hypothetical protein